MQTIVRTDHSHSVNSGKPLCVISTLPFGPHVCVSVCAGFFGDIVWTQLVFDRSPRQRAGAAKQRVVFVIAICGPSAKPFWVCWCVHLTAHL